MFLLLSQLAVYGAELSACQSCVSLLNPPASAPVVKPLLATAPWSRGTTAASVLLQCKPRSREGTRNTGGQGKVRCTLAQCHTWPWLTCHSQVATQINVTQPKSLQASNPGSLDEVCEFKSRCWWQILNSCKGGGGVGGGCRPLKCLIKINVMWEESREAELFTLELCQISQTNCCILQHRQADWQSSSILHWIHSMWVFFFF